MDLLDSTIVNIAAPSIACDLHCSTAALQWMTGGYSLTFAVFLIAGAAGRPVRTSDPVSSRRKGFRRLLLCVARILD